MNSVAKLLPNPKNPRTITPEKLAMLKKSLLEFGDLSGVVLNRKSRQLVGGHQRIQSLDKKAIVHVTKQYAKPTKTGTVAEGYIESQGERFSYREVNWSLVKEKAANIAANKGAGEWNTAQLSEWMKELKNTFDFDLDLTMFDEKERNELLGEGVKAAPGEDNIPGIPKKAKTKSGDIYELGNHRLLCGDATKEKDVERFLRNEKECFCFTSPPYNVGASSSLRKKNGTGKKSFYEDGEYTDDQSQESYLSFLRDFTDCVLSVSEIAFINVQMLAGNKFIFPEYWMNFRDHVVDVMVWDKEYGAPAMPKNVLNLAFEFVFILSKDKKANRVIKTAPEFRGTVSNIVRINPRREGKEEIQKDHGAVFPVSFAEYFILKFSTNHIIFDPFGGTGTTMIAAEKLGRKSRCIELNPIYCDVIVQRWEDFTGKKAKLISSKSRN
jgi:DNA modification methylase